MARTSLQLVAMLAVLSMAAAAQTHRVVKTEDVVRAVGVYEWTGELPKPSASRLIPVSLFINGGLQDAAVYLASPVPFALLSGNVYEIDDAGISHGTLDLVYARHLSAPESASTTYDDGWFGYGAYVPPSPPKAAAPLKASRSMPVIASSADPSGRPHFSSNSATPAAAPTKSTTADTPPAGDPDRPTLKRHSDTTEAADTTQAAPDTKAAKPIDTDQGGEADRPTMTRNEETPQPKGSSGATVTAIGGDPSDDPDRPTLKHHGDDKEAKESSKAAKNGGADVGSVSAAGTLNDDPSRPNLHRGKPVTAMNETDLPRLSGLPPDMNQRVAVSDPANRTPHDFSRAWDDDEQRRTILHTMQETARNQLAAYVATPAPATPAAPVAKPAAKTSARPGVKTRTPVAAPPAPAPVVELVDERLKAYTLSYGGAPTYVYSAHTEGEGTGLRYVTLVAQVDMQGTPRFALMNVTDATHLDRTPRMRLVDAVDAEASNRASLLFELRGEGSRQFALYRVIGARAEQIFTTGSTQ
jgi:hypothetical protein